VERARVVIRRAAALAVAAVACKAAPHPEWPALPHDASERQEIVARFTRRPATARPQASPKDVLAAARARKWKNLVAGEANVVAFVTRWLENARASGHEAYLLFGVSHATGAPIDVFRRIVGPGGAPFAHVAIEQLAADGRWSGRAEDEQRGDSHLLAEYLATGSAESFAALARAHEAHDYTAWKFGYTARVLDVVVAGRARGVPVLACDMPDALKRAAREGGATDDDVNRLRELHCLLALRDARASGAAVLWGAAHVEPEGFRRYLPAGAAVLSVRVLDKVAELAGDMALVGDDDEATLLLPEQALDVDRVRDPAAAGAMTLRARATNALIDGAEIGATLDPGVHTLVVEGEPLFVVAFRCGRGATEIDVDRAARSVRIVVAP
jgi:hypothetical protein